MKGTFRDRRGAEIISILILMLMFFQPINAMISTLLVILLLVMIVLHPVYRQYIFSQYFTPWGLTAICLFIFIVIASLWSDAPYSMQNEVIGKYCKLAYFPIIVLGFISSRTRYLALNIYLASIVLTCILSILKAKGIVNIGLEGDQGEVFYNHIMTGFMVAFASYLALLFAFQRGETTKKELQTGITSSALRAPSPHVLREGENEGVEISGWHRLIYLAIFLFCSFQLIFINNGRTGYLVYFVLMILFIGQNLSLKQALVGIVIFTGIYSLGYFASPVMQKNVNQLLNDAVMFQQNQKNTSLGYRIQFHHYARSLFLEHPIVGVGTGGFQYHFYEDNPVPKWGRVLSDAHSQYWMLLAEQGVVGFGLFLLFMSSLFIVSMLVKSSRAMLLGFLCAFCIGSLSDSILSYSVVGHILILMTALGIGELLERKLEQSSASKSLGRLGNILPNI